MNGAGTPERYKIPVEFPYPQLFLLFKSRKSLTALIFESFWAIKDRISLMVITSQPLILIKYSSVALEGF